MSTVIIVHGGGAKSAIDSVIAASSTFGVDKCNEVDAYLQTVIHQLNEYVKTAP